MPLATSRSNRHLTPICIALVLLITACSSNSTTPCTPSAITVSGGATPSFRVTPCVDAQSLEVRDVETQAIVWSIGARDGTTLPDQVTYGRPPANAIVSIPAAALVPGRQYQVMATAICCGDIITAYEQAVFVAVP